MINEIKSKLDNKFKEYENNLINDDKELKSFKTKKEFLNEFLKNGFPTVKVEDYKYINFSFLNDLKLNIPNDIRNQINETILEKYLFTNLTSNLLVFENGFLNKELSKIQSFKKSIYVGNLKEANSNDLNSYLSDNILSDDPFYKLNYSIADDGAYVVIPDGTSLVEPIHIAFFADTSDQSYFIQQKNIIRIGECSNLKIILSFHTVGDNYSFNNVATDIHLGNFSNLELYIIEKDNEQSHLINNTIIYQYRGSILNTATISLNGKLVRNNLESYHNDELCETNFNGFYFGQKNNFIDNHTLVVHSKPNCNSNETYKGILDDSSTAVFNGKILVEPNAIKTNAYQKNRNILLSDKATINTKPQLEIFADDVKCSHGATSGNLEKEHIFYLKSRGISEDRAIALLLNAFATDIVEKINLPELRDEIKAEISRRLKVEEDFYFCEILEHT